MFTLVFTRIQILCGERGISALGLDKCLHSFTFWGVGRGGVGDGVGGSGKVGEKSLANSDFNSFLNTYLMKLSCLPPVDKIGPLHLVSIISSF